MIQELKDIEDGRLHAWCREGKYKKVEEYITSSPNLASLLVYRRGVFGNTPLHEAASYNRPRILQLLIDHGGDVNCRANGGYTPLHLSAYTGHVNCVRVLLENNADTSLTDNYNKTPMQTAENAARLDVLRVLKSAGKYQYVSDCVIHLLQQGSVTQVHAVGWSVTAVEVTFIILCMYTWAT